MLRLFWHGLRILQRCNDLPSAKTTPVGVWFLKYASEYPHPGPDTASGTAAASGHVVLGGQVILRIRVRHTLTSLERIVSGSALQMVSVRVHASLDQASLIWALTLFIQSALPQRTHC